MWKITTFYSFSYDSTSLKLPFTCGNLPVEPNTHSTKISLQLVVLLAIKDICSSWTWKIVIESEIQIVCLEEHSKGQRWVKRKWNYVIFIFLPSKKCIEIWTHWSSHLDGDQVHPSLWYRCQTKGYNLLGVILYSFAPIEPILRQKINKMIANSIPKDFFSWFSGHFRLAQSKRKIPKNTIFFDKWMYW